MEKQDKERKIRLPDTGKLLASTSPHMHSGESVRQIMSLVILTLMPALCAGVYFFGLRALLVLVLCIVSCLAVEIVMGRMTGRPDSWKDCSAILTGILLGMNLSAGVPWWICLIGAVLAIGLGKQLFGGIGYNPFNPALVARVGLLIGFPQIMTTWVKPVPGKLAADIVTTATPLDIPPENAVYSGKMFLDAFLGNIGGCLGETSAATLLLGGILLISLRLIRWQIPVAFIGTVYLVTLAVNLASPGTTAPAHFHIVTGGLFLGAFFMATDMVTSPMTKWGSVVFGTGCGLITAAIRIWGNYPEGVSFAILIMNAFTPLIDRYTGKNPFGFIKLATENSNG